MMLVCYLELFTQTRNYTQKKIKYHPHIYLEILSSNSFNFIIKMFRCDGVIDIIERVHHVLCQN